MPPLWQGFLTTLQAQLSNQVVAGASDAAQAVQRQQALPHQG
ncbi:MAG: hypothetical protein ACK57J_11270 [Rubrivivax sp.]